MSNQPDRLIDKLLELGLSRDEAVLYLHLLQDSPKSVLVLSRELKLGRNVIYRLVERLQALHLVKEVKSSSGLRVAATSYTNLERQIEKKEEELARVKSSARDLFGSLAEFVSASEQGSLAYYSGAEGLLQITVNSLQARDELLIFELDLMTGFIEFDTAEKIRQQFAENKIFTKQITNLKEIKAHTKSSETIRHYWEPRYISPDLFSIEFEFLIYNDTVAMYTFLDDQPWGLEVTSPAVAEMQRRLFHYVWKTAQKMRKVDNFGHAVLD